MRRFSPGSVFLVMACLSGFASTLIFTVLAVYYVLAVGMNPFQLVLVGTVLEATILLFEVPTGVVADTYSRRRSIIIGTVILGVAFVFEGALPLFAAVLLAEVIRGVGETFLSGATQAWIAGEVGEQQVGRLFVRAAQLRRIAGLIGALVGAGLATIHLSLPIVLGGALYLGLGVFLLLAMPERGFQATPPGDRPAWRALGGTLWTGLRLVQRQTVLLLAVGTGVVVGAAGEGFDRLWEAHFLISLTLPTLGGLAPVVWFGVITAGMQLLALGATAILHRRLDANDDQAVTRGLLLLTAITIAGIVGFGLAGTFAVALACFLVAAVTRSLIGPLYEGWLVRQIEPSVRATVLSLASQGNAFGQVIGGPVIGAVGTIASLRAAMTLTGLLLTPALLLYGRVLRGVPRPVPEPASPLV